jgi:hypothetical protein
MFTERKSKSTISASVSNGNDNTHGDFGPATEKPVRSFRGLRSRYDAFLEKPEEKEPGQITPSGTSRLSQSAINLVIFCALVVVILTAFGVGFAWFGGASKAVPIQPDKSDNPVPQNTPKSHPSKPDGHVGGKLRPATDIQASNK